MEECKDERWKGIERWIKECRNRDMKVKEIERWKITRMEKKKDEGMKRRKDRGLE